MKYDLLIIGGGINGLGIAADAAARGLSVLLTEKEDLGSGTTSASSRLIHGGLRYLQYGEISLVHESLRERGILARQRPHLVHPIQLLIPSYRALPPPAWKVRIGLFLYNQLANDRLFPSARGLRRQATLEREPGLNGDGLTGGFLYPDGQVEFPERLCVDLAQEAIRYDAVIRTHTRVTSLLQSGTRVTGAVLRDELNGRTEEVEATLTINAAGPWVDEVNRLLPTPPPKMIGGTWGTHLVLPARPNGPQGHLYAAARKDGRPFFILPWDGRLLVGTTDVRFEGDLDALRVQDWEVEYLLQETNTLFPGCGYTAADVQFTTIGVRPLPASDRAAGAITRRHFLVDHGDKHGVPGLASVVGGKLTTYRSLAEEVVDIAGKLVHGSGWSAPCPTRELRGIMSPAELERAVQAELHRLGIGSEGAGRLVRLYGPRYGEVLALIGKHPELGQPLVGGCPALAAEVVHAVRTEAARTVDDIARRRLMLLPPSNDVLDAIRSLCRSRNLEIAA